MVNMVRIDYEREKMEFVNEIRISQRIKNIAKAKELGIISEQSFEAKVAKVLAL